MSFKLNTTAIIAAFFYIISPIGVGSSTAIGISGLVQSESSNGGVDEVNKPFQLNTIAQAAAVVGNIISAIGVGSSTAIGIFGMVQSGSNNGGVDQDSLVRGYCRKMYHQLKKARRSQYTVVLHKSGLNVKMRYARGGYIDFVQLGGVGYDLYFVRGGYIQNNDARGFYNWCVCGGNQRQDDNVITFK